MPSHVGASSGVYCQRLFNFFHPVIRQAGRVSIVYYDPFPFFYWVLCSMHLVLATRWSSPSRLSRLSEPQIRLLDLMERAVNTPTRRWACA